jgi:hypothetical protein
MNKLKPIIDKIAAATIVARDATQYWFSRMARLWIFAFAASLFFSALVFFFAPLPKARYYLEFPNAISGKMIGEVRYAPFHFSLEKSALSLCREILVGPANYLSSDLLSKDTRIRSVLVRGRTLYVDLSSDLVLGEPSGGSFRDSLEIFRKTIKKNLPGLGNVILTVDGFVPYADNSEEKPR